MCFDSPLFTSSSYLQWVLQKFPAWKHSRLLMLVVTSQSQLTLMHEFFSCGVHTD
jgi:hypothetical protein